MTEGEGRAFRFRIRRVGDHSPPTLSAALTHPSAVAGRFLDAGSLLSFVGALAEARLAQEAVCRRSPQGHWWAEVRAPIPKAAPLVWAAGGKPFAPDERGWRPLPVTDDRGSTPATSLVPLDVSDWKQIELADLIATVPLQPDRIPPLPTVQVLVSGALGQWVLRRVAARGLQVKIVTVTRRPLRGSQSDSQLLLIRLSAGQKDVPVSLMDTISRLPDTIVARPVGLKRSRLLIDVRYRAPLEELLLAAMIPAGETWVLGGPDVGHWQLTGTGQEIEGARLLAESGEDAVPGPSLPEDPVSEDQIGGRVRLRGGGSTRVRTSAGTRTRGGEVQAKPPGRQQPGSQRSAPGRCARRRDKVEVPPEITDRLSFSVTTPSVMAPGQAHVVDVWVHHLEQRQRVIELAQQEYAEKSIRIKSKSGIEVARGTVLTIRLDMPGFEIDDPEDIVLWGGDIGNATFPVLVPASITNGPHRGTVAVFANGLQCAKVHFVVEVGTSSTQPAPADVTSETRVVRTAFASYAHDDQSEVSGRIQGMVKALPSLQVFMDVFSLRSGEDWQARLLQEIQACDIFYLFWSRAASQSEWVDREWRLALRHRGIAYINPVPLCRPEEAPPPSELAGKLHFNDWMLSLMRGQA